MNPFDKPRNPPPNVHIPWSWNWYDPRITPVDLYKQAGNRGRKEPSKQVYGKRVNRKWAVS